MCIFAVVLWHTVPDNSGNMAGNKRHKKGVYLSLKICKSKGSRASFYAHDKTIKQTQPYLGASGNN